MWKSKEDFIKDLAHLNDFGTPEDLEPYKVFYTNGRGSSIKKSLKTSSEFTDSRSGEVIDIDDLVLNVDDKKNKSKGRGRLLCGFSSSKLQLEKQLRLAKPMGSSDEAIVSYFNKTRQKENSAESDTQSQETDSKILPPDNET